MLIISIASIQEPDVFVLQNRFQLIYCRLRPKTHWISWKYFSLSLSLEIFVSGLQCVCSTLSRAKSCRKWWIRHYFSLENWKFYGLSLKAMIGSKNFFCGSVLWQSKLRANAKIIGLSLDSKKDMPNILKYANRI